MPKTKIFLRSICESIEEFRFRRLDIAYKYLQSINEDVTESKLLRLAGIKDK